MNLNALKLLTLCVFQSCKTTNPLRPTVSINPHDVVKSPLHLSVNSMGVWHAHEGELGHVQLIDQQGNELATGILSTSEDWMKSGSILFQTVLEFNSKENKRGYLTIHNYSGVGDGSEAGEKLSFKIPVRFEP
jgi:uncharacterized protein YrzB (UPF0473 family)